MKLTKEMIRNLIKEEIEASLEEAPKVPAQVDRGLDMVMGDGGDERVLEKIKDMMDKLDAQRKAAVAQQLLARVGLPSDLNKLRAALGAAPEEKQGEQSAE